MLKQLVSGNDAVAMRNQIGKQLKHLRSEGHACSRTVQFIALGVKGVVTKHVEHRREPPFLPRPGSPVSPSSPSESSQGAAKFNATFKGSLNVSLFVGGGFLHRGDGKALQSGELHNRSYGL
jgi:hypothetical protein